MEYGDAAAKMRGCVLNGEYAPSEALGASGHCLNRGAE
jgi:hypothetical protein